MLWESAVIERLQELCKKTIRLISISPVSGGDINESFYMSTSAGDYFIKINSASRFPQMFEKEASGLNLLTETGEIKVPKHVEFGEKNDVSFLIMDFIRSGSKSRSFWNDFGQKLANLHKHSSNYFGLDYDNYIGSLKQSNKKHKTWSAFFMEERLDVQVKLARNNGQIGKETVMSFDRFYKKLNEIFPFEPSSLLHGDLWGGNYMVDEKGDPVVIDPAIYYGHREMDLGMTKLFGGFDPRFYDAYNQSYPLESGWQKRMDFCNLYPLMVHVNLFGGSYINSVKSILRKFN
jgi:fructosamine-3-kinase